MIQDDEDSISELMADKDKKSRFKLEKVGQVRRWNSVQSKTYNIYIINSLLQIRQLCYNLLTNIFIKHYTLWYENDLFEYLVRFSYFQKLTMNIIMIWERENTLFRKYCISLSENNIYYIPINFIFLVLLILQSVIRFFRSARTLWFSDSYHHSLKLMHSTH